MTHNTLTELLYGKHAHANPIACVEDVTAELAARLAQGFPHSIWEIVWHMNYWMEYEIKRIHGENPAYPGHAAGSWPSDTFPDEPDWSREVVRFTALIDELTGLARSDEETLDRPVRPPTDVADPSHSGEPVTVLDVLWQTVVHNSYHVGQVALLRRALGIWPPQGGGDSW
ncbi:MAG: DinB family protein [Acidobacteriia bacterium]|nr:DinB family protein [Terriglobia bacterium]